MKVREGFLQEESSDLSLQIGIRVSQEEGARQRENQSLEMCKIMAHLGRAIGFRHEEKAWDEA